jgi:hypothetical protein
LEGFLNGELRTLESLDDDEDDNDDEALVTQVALSLLTLLPALTLNVWLGPPTNVAKQRVGSLLAEYYATKQQNNANEDVVMAIENEGPGSTTMVNNLVDSRYRECVEKLSARLDQMERVMKRTARLNSSGPGQVGLPSTVTGDGRGPRGKSPVGGKKVAISEPSEQRNGRQQKKKQPTSILKDPPSQNPNGQGKKKTRTRGRENQGRGGRGRGGRGNRGGPNNDGRNKSGGRS